MPDVKFGFGQIAAQTPKTISLIKRALNFFSGGVIVFLPQIASLFHTSVDTLTTIMGIALLAINTVGIMFGVDPDSTTTKTT